MEGRLNLFQRTMLQWDAVHPYNAVHVVRIPAPFHKEKLKTIVDTILENRGLAALVLDPGRGTFHYGGGPADCEIRLLEGIGPSRPALGAEIERQLNTRFEIGGRFIPFRFFVAAEPEAFLLGLVYFHPVADAESIVHLLHEIVESFVNGSPHPVPPVPDLYPPPHDNVLRQRPAVVWNRIRQLPAFIRNIRRSSRPPYRDPRDFTNGFALFTLDRRELHCLVAAGRRLEVTIHDLLLALLMHSVSRLEGARRRTGRRRRISIGSIVNTRKDLGIESRRAFGLFLGSFVVGVDVRESDRIADLARQIREMTARIKEQQLYLGMPMELAAVRKVLTFYSTERRERFYQKHFPLWGGITNMNLNPIWTRPPGGQPLDYFRGVSTGPATPLVLSVTTAHESVHVGVSHRATVFSRDDIDRLEREFRGTLETLADREGA